MALWPNGRHMTRSSYKGYGVAPGLDASIKANSDRMNRFLSLNPTASTPDGYGVKTFLPPVTAGSMSTQQRVASASGDSYLLAGGPMAGSGSISMTVEGGMSLVVGMSANTVMASLTGNGMVLKLTIGLNGEGSWSLTGTPNLAMIVPFDGSGAVASLTGTSDLRGRLSMEGEWTPFTELSPEGLAAAVWNSLLSQYQDDGTAGKALSLASSGGVDLNALAQAVWQYIIEAGFSAEDLMRIQSAALAGTSTKAGATITFKGVDGTTDRIIGSFDAENNRTGAILDGD